MKLQKILAVFTAAAVLASLTACGKPKTPKAPSSSEPLSVSASSQPASSQAPAVPDTETPEGVTKIVLEANKTLDFDTLNKYSDNNGGMGSSVKEGPAKDLMTAMFGSITYSVGTAKVDGDTATVQAEITNKDQTKVLEGMIPTLMGEVLKNGGELSPDTDQYIVMLTEQIKQAEGTHAATVQVTLKKDGGVWKVHYDEALLDALSGGLLGSVKDLSEKLGGMGIDIGSMIG